MQDQTKALVLLSETHCQEFSIFKPKKFFLNGKSGYNVRTVAESCFSQKQCECRAIWAAAGNPLLAVTPNKSASWANSIASETIPIKLENLGGLLISGCRYAGTTDANLPASTKLRAPIKRVSEPRVEANATDDGKPLQMLFCAIAL